MCLKTSINSNRKEKLANILHHRQCKSREQEQSLGNRDSHLPCLKKFSSYAVVESKGVHPGANRGTPVLRSKKFVILTKLPAYTS